MSPRPRAGAGFWGRSVPGVEMPDISQRSLGVDGGLGAEGGSGSTGGPGGMLRLAGVQVCVEGGALDLLLSSGSLQPMRETEEHGSL